MDTKPKSREELAREVELLKSKIQTLKEAQVRIEREAMQLADAINGQKFCETAIGN
jgi:chaperonin cofactor prefoldin